MENAKLQVAERLKQATNVLVTVSSNPSVDQLAACIGLTLILNKIDKHGTAVFSGNIPSTIEFLQPENTLEKTTDSLRDFIIALDKSKADKLRYKVEDKVVKIFITPYRTTISEKDLNFSQGDFNVDVVICLGVHQQTDLDQAITSHGRILHDATVISINNTSNVDLGSINWQDTSASSLSELVVQLADELDKNVLDSQISTALLTGIVAETERFSNAKTSPQTMSISARLMTSGANQQLVATKLQQPLPPNNPPALPPIPSTQPLPPPPSDTTGSTSPPKDDGVLEVEHGETNSPQSPAPVPTPEQIHIDEEGVIRNLNQPTPAPVTAPLAELNSTTVNMSGGNPISTPPTGPTSSTTSSLNQSNFSPLSLPPIESVNPSLAPPLTSSGEQPNPSSAMSSIAPNQSDKTLEQLEEAVHSPHLQQPSTMPTPSLNEVTNTSNDSSAQATSIENARNAVAAALSSQPDPNPQPIQALGATPVFDGLNSQPAPPTSSPTFINSPATALPTPNAGQNSDADFDRPSGAPHSFTGADDAIEPLDALDMPQPSMGFSGPGSMTQPIGGPTPPPPVPPPMTFIQPNQPPPPNAGQNTGSNVSGVAF